MVFKAPTPSFDGLLSIFCKHLGFQVEMGSFVVYAEDGGKAGRSKWSVGRLLDTRAMYRDPKDVDIKLQVFKLLKESELCGTRSRIVGNTAFIPEVVQTDITIWVPKSFVVSLCFVFLQKELLEFFNCQGMSNIYQVRYAQDSTEVSQLKHFASDYVAFPGLSCAGSRVWNDVRRSQNTLATLLSTKRQGQGTYCSQSGKTTVSLEGWAYIKNVLASSEHLDLSKIVNLQVSINRFAVGPGMASKATSVKVKAQKVRFQSVGDLAFLVSLLGEACLFGTRDPRPKNDKTAFLRAHACINHVQGVAEACRQPRKRTTDSGVDFTYCAEVEELRIVVRYHSYINNPSVQSPFKRMQVLINFGDPSLLDDNDDDDSNEEDNDSVGTPAFECGTQFMYGNETATITAVLLNGSVEAELPTGVVVFVEYDETKALVDAYTKF